MLPAEVEELYRRYGYAVQRRCHRLLNSQAAADDALQEVFVRVLRYGASFDGEQPLAWLYRVADNVCFDRLGSERRARAKHDDLAGLEAERQADHETPPDRQRLLAEVLACSAPSERRAALLYYFDGMTHSEIARLLGCSREAISHRLGRFHSEARRLLSRGESS
jgi:RNA polymerase sigma factor (sigma-70 family)